MTLDLIQVELFNCYNNILTSVHVDNSRKDILSFAKDPREALDDVTLTAEAKYPIGFSEQQKKF